MASNQWTGTSQHPNARDLSDYLVHLTKSKEDLEAILQTGVIEARSPHGLARHTAPNIAGQHSVCFTETPIPDLSRIAARGRHFGIVFRKERLRTGHRALPIWYVTEDSTQHGSLRALMSASSASPAEPIWSLTPFIDLVISDGSRTHDFRWEREWRIMGDFNFFPEEIAAIVVPDPNGELEPLMGAVGNLLYATPAGDFYWVGGEEDVFDDALELLIDKFHSEFIPAHDAGLPLDEESRYGLFEVIDIVMTWDAAYEIFENLPERLRETVIDRVENEYGDLWCRQHDLDHAHE